MADKTPPPENPDNHNTDDPLADRLAAYDETLRDEALPLDSPEDDDWDDDDGEWEDLAQVVKRLNQHWASDDSTMHSIAPAPVTGSQPARTTVGRFALGHELGRGGFGVVYKGYDAQRKQFVAIKIPRSDFLASDDAQKRFDREAKIAASLKHLGIVPVYEAGTDGDVSYIVSQFCDGPDLRKWLQDHPDGLPPEAAAEIAAELADALEYAHDNGVLHRDMKPGNVLLVPLEAEAEAEAKRDTSAGLAFRPCLTDFGLAQMQSPEWSRTRTSLVVGTPLYMAPECFRKAEQRWTPAVDIYGLGAVMYEMLTGHPPIEAEGLGQLLERIASTEPLPPCEINEKVPTALSVICMKCLAKDAEDRYASAGDLADDLRRFLHGKPIRARAPTWRDHFAKWCRQPQRVFFAGRYSLWLHLLIVGWLLLLFGIFVGFPMMPREQLWRSARDILLASATVHFPKAWVGWKVLHGSRWAFWVSAMSSGVCLLIFLYASLGNSLFFGHNYTSPVPRLSVLLILLAASAFDLGAHLVAIPAFLRLRSQSR